MTAQLGLAFDAPPPAPPRRRSFHVRSHMTLAEAQAGEARAKGQDRVVLEFFRYHDDQGDGWHTRWTPSEVREGLLGWAWMEDPPPTILLTSVRRALTNLTKAGLLRKHPEDRRMGPRGARECTWSLPE